MMKADTKRTHDRYVYFLLLFQNLTVLIRDEELSGST